MWQVINSPSPGYWAVARAEGRIWVFHATRFRSIDTARKCANRLNWKRAPGECVMFGDFSRA